MQEILPRRLNTADNQTAEIKPSKEALTRVSPTITCKTPEPIGINECAFKNNVRNPGSDFEKDFSLTD